MTTAPASTRKASEARARLLATSARLFYADGIRAVGVDRIIVEAKVTRATFYRHFPGKQELVLAYVEAEDRAVRERFATAAASRDDPAAMLRSLVAGLGEQMCAPGFRGCPFINAAAEFPDPDDPVHRAVLTHRRWFVATLEQLLAAARHPDPATGARLLVFLRDGAMVGGYFGDPHQAASDLTAAVAIVTGLL